MSLQQVIEQYHSALDQFSRGDGAPVKTIFSHQDDVLLANPFGPAVLGWPQVSRALDFASSRFRDGEVTGIEPVARYETPDLVAIFEIERWKAKVAGRQTVETFELRVTTTFRHENGDWKIVHRHADPIATFHPEGPLRWSGG